MMVKSEECEKSYMDLIVTREVLNELIKRTVNDDVLNPLSIFDKATVIFARLIKEHFELVKKYEMALEKLEESEWEYKGKVMTREMWNELFENGIRNGEIKK